VLVEKLVFDFHLDEEIGRVQVSHAAWFLMLAGLLQIHAITWDQSSVTSRCSPQHWGQMRP